MQWKRDEFEAWEQLIFQKTIKVRKQNNYGRELHYPTDSVGEFYCRLCKTDTFTEHMMDEMKDTKKNLQQGEEWSA